MGSIGPLQVVIVAVVVVLLFGRGKISAVMGDVAKGITSFKKGLKDEGKDDTTIEAQATETTSKSEDKSAS